MAWVKLESRYPRHPKVLSVPLAARYLNICAWCWCAEHLTDGVVPRQAVAFLDRAIPRALQLADRLVRVGLWERTKDGYRVHDYLHYNPSAEEVHTAEDERARLAAEAAERGRMGGLRSVAARRLKFGSARPEPAPKRPLRKPLRRGVRTGPEAGASNTLRTGPEAGASNTLRTGPEAGASNPVRTAFEASGPDRIGEEKEALYTLSQDTAARAGDARSKTDSNLAKKSRTDGSGGAPARRRAPGETGRPGKGGDPHPAGAIAENLVAGLAARRAAAKEGAGAPGQAKARTKPRAREEGS